MRVMVTAWLRVDREDIACTNATGEPVDGGSGTRVFETDVMDTVNAAGHIRF